MVLCAKTAALWPAFSVLWCQMHSCCLRPWACSVTCEEAYLVGVAGLKDVTGHLGLRVVRLTPQEIGKIREVIAVVDEPRDELRFVLEYEDWGVVAAGGYAADEWGIKDQLNFSRLHRGAAVAPLTPPADLCHQPRQHGQSGPPVQRGPADVSKGEPRVGIRGTALPLIPALHVDPADFGLKLLQSDAGLKITFRGVAFYTFKTDASKTSKARRCFAQFAPVPVFTSMEKVQRNNMHNMCSPCRSAVNKTSQKSLRWTVSPSRTWSTFTYTVMYLRLATLLHYSTDCIATESNSPALYCSN